MLSPEDIDAQLAQLAGGHAVDPALEAARTRHADLQAQATRAAAGLADAQATLIAAEEAAELALLSGGRVDEAALTTARQQLHVLTDCHRLLRSAATTAETHVQTLEAQSASRLAVALTPVFTALIASMEPLAVRLVELEQRLARGHAIAQSRLGSGHPLAQGYGGLLRRETWLRWRARTQAAGLLADEQVA